MTTTKDKTMFNLENGAKLVALLVVGYNITTGIDDIKKDIALIKQGEIYEIKQLQYQITECCGNKGTEKRIVLNQSQAILPNSIELENEK